MSKIIRTMQLIHDYLQKDEDGKIESRDRVLQGISIDIEAGSFVVLLGHNGSGKSTLARHLNALLMPTEGTVWVDGHDTKDPSVLLPVRQTAGMVFQNPDNQIIASVVEEDVAFGPENTGVPTDEIWQRVGESLESVGMTAYRYHSPNRLSGGQKQRIAIAGIMAMQPSCMILDEATAMLDPLGRREVLEAVHDLNRKKGVTVILITHHMDEAVEADRVLVLDQGHVAMDGTPREVFSRVEELKGLRLDVPQITELAWQLRRQGMALPEGILEREELLAALERILNREKAPIAGVGTPDGGKVLAANENAKNMAPLIRFEDVSCVYSPHTAFEKRALENISFTVEAGSFVGIIGHTGSGKSTLLQHLNGLIAPTEGQIYFHGEDISAPDYKKRELCARVGLVFQYPEYQLFEVDVLSDVAFGPKNLGLNQQEAEERAREALALVGIEESQYKKSPFELSGGQKRRVAIAGVLAMRPEVLVLDEPAAGLDPATKRDMMEMIQELHMKQGITVILSSHSMEDMALYAERLLVMNQGKIVMEGTPAEVFAACDYLESIGLSAPQVTRLMNELARQGYPVRSHVLTVQQAAEEIMGLYRNRETAEADGAVSCQEISGTDEIAIHLGGADNDT